MRQQQKNAILFALFILILWGAFGWATRSMHFGFYLEPDKAGQISLQQTFANQQKTLTKYHSTESGYVSFNIDPTATHFSFRFLPMGSPYKIKSMSLWGVPLFSSNWIWEKINPSEPLHNQITFLPKGELLPYKITESVQTVDYIRFFDVLLKMFRYVRITGFILFSFLIILPILSLSSVRISAGSRTIYHSLRSLRLLLDNKLVFYLSMFVVLTLSFPSPVIPVETGLDPSWTCLINQLAFKKMFGCSVVFTYGPLGFLLFPQASGLNVQFALICNIIQLVILAGIYTFIFIQDKTLKPLAWCLLACHFIPTRIPEWQWTMLPIMMICILALHTALSKKATVVLLILSSMGCVFVSMIKFSGFIIIFSTSLVALSYFIVCNKKRSIIAITTYFSSFIIFFCFACAMLFSSPHAFIVWVNESFDISSGYNLYMLANKSWAELCLPFFYLSATVVAITWGFRDWRIKLIRVALFSPLFFFLVKYAIVRQSVDPLLYIGPLIITLLSLHADEAWQARLRFVFFFQLLVAFLLSWFSSFSGVSSLPIVGLSFNNLKKTISLHDSINNANQATMQNLSTSKLPQDWLALIGTNSVQSLPKEHSFIIANHLNAVPVYTLQGYASLSHALDMKSSGLYISDQAPQFILCEFFSLDGRNMFLETPCVWRNIRQKYRLVKHTQHLLLLERKSGHADRLACKKSTTIKAGEWFDTTVFSGNQVSVQWPITPRGKVIAFLLRNDMTFITIEYVDGTIQKYRILPDTLQAPFDLDLIPRNLSDLITIFTDSSNPNMQARRVKFDSNYNFYYSKNIIIQHYQ